MTTLQLWTEKFQQETEPGASATYTSEQQYAQSSILRLAVLRGDCDNQAKQGNAYAADNVVPAFFATWSQQSMASIQWRHTDW
jgi:hypothetical protein